MPDQISFIDLGGAWRRLLLFAPAALVLAVVWLAGRWLVGDTLATYPPSAEVARAAARLAPDDPQTHFTVGVFARMDFTPEGLQETVRNFERATALSPHDYRMWMELGRAREQAGDTEGGEAALRRAVRIAPNYVMPRWFLGNLLLRAGKTDEAFAFLRSAAESEHELRGPIFASVWSIYNGDVGRVTEAMGDAPAVRADLIGYLVNLKRTEDARRLWATLTPQDKRREREASQALLGALLGEEHFAAALDVYRGARGEESSAEVGRVTNGGFESEIGSAAQGKFDWEVSTAQQAQIALDPKTVHGGARSLRISFNAPSNVAFNNFSQLIVVEPGARYRLEFFVRTESLKSVSTLVVDVLDAATGKVLASSPPSPGGTTEWKPVVLEWAAPPAADGVRVQLRRQPCLDEVCPIFGKVWYDDFSLQRAGAGPAGARAAGDDRQQRPQQRQFAPAR